MHQAPVPRLLAERRQDPVPLQHRRPGSTPYRRSIRSSTRPSRSSSVSSRSVTRQIRAGRSARAARWAATMRAPTASGSVKGRAGPPPRAGRPAGSAVATGGWPRPRGRPRDRRAAASARTSLHGRASGPACRSGRGRGARRWNGAGPASGPARDAPHRPAPPAGIPRRDRRSARRRGGRSRAPRRCRAGQIPHRRPHDVLGRSEVRRPGRAAAPGARGEPHAVAGIAEAPRRERGGRTSQCRRSRSTKAPRPPPRSAPPPRRRRRGARRRRRRGACRASAWYPPPSPRDRRRRGARGRSC